VDIIEFCRKLSPEDWYKPVTLKWRVKDVISHLVGWERECVQELRKGWATHTEPWFMETEHYDQFNARIYNEFKDYSPDDIITELTRWKEALSAEIEKIGEKNIRKSTYAGWVFDEGDEPHFEHHMKQIQKTLSEK
jgi:hypothetical protein